MHFMTYAQAKSVKTNKEIRHAGTSLHQPPSQNQEQDNNFEIP